MALAVRFIQPIRASVSAITSPSSTLPHPRIPFNGKFELLRTWIKGLQPVVIHSHGASISHWKLCIQRNHLRNFFRPGLKLSTSIFSASVAFGSFSLWPFIAYAIDGPKYLVDDHRIRFSGGTDSEEDPHTFLQFLMKLWLPVLLVLTVLMNWDHPIILTTKVILILLGTKPSPFSVYLFVEQLRSQSMHHQPLFYKFKSLYAKKVEVEDYTFLCLARVEWKDQKFTLIGILGSWWVLPPPSCLRAFFAL